MNFEGSELITLFDIVLLCLRLGYACVYSGTSLVHWSSLAVCFLASVMMMTPVSVSWY